MKKIISFITLFSFLIISTVSINASSIGGDSQGVSEYEMLLQYSNKTESELREMGVDSNYIKDLLNLQKTIDTYATYDSKKLTKLGFSEEQIVALTKYNMKKNVISYFSTFGFRSAVSSEEPTKKVMDLSAMRSLFSSSVDFNVRLSSAGSTFYGDYVELSYNWEWDGRPLLLLKDGIGFEWDGKFRAISSGTSATVEYEDMFGYIETTENFRPEISIGAWGHTFDLNTGSSEYPNFAHAGYGTMELENVDSLDSMQITAKYGHASWAFSSVSISFTGPGLGISFGKNTTIKGQDSFIIRDLQR